MTLISINPTDGEEIRRHAEDSPEEIERKISDAAQAFAQWRTVDVVQRGECLIGAAERIVATRGELSELLAQEMGKPLGQAEREVDRFAERCRYFAEHTVDLLAPERVGVDGAEHWIRFEPLGVALGIMPWNYPFGQASRWAVPALMAGNTALLKHASNVTMCANAMEDIFTEAGFPRGVFTVLRVSSSRLAPVIADSRIASVSLTGSEEAGVSVGRLAGASLKKMVLELGGSDPFIVLGDADIKAAAAVATRARTQNCGQTCTAAKRFIVAEAIADEFEECLVHEFELLRVGDPLDPDTDLGPLATADGVTALAEQVKESVNQGARVAFAAPAVESPGFFSPPIVLVDVTADMTVAREETFGPVAPIIRVRNEEAAVQAANASSYGLGASVWTGDRDRGLLVANALDVGMVAVNGLVLADPRLPFGGVKRSGFGREMSVHGIRELTNIKTVSVAAGL
jgi:succinate-semialdehyde dehydrogenase/glutarate-semialdehyde dehydrogenase